jgi:hypothetical protein
MRLLAIAPRFFICCILDDLLLFVLIGLQFEFAGAPFEFSDGWNHQTVRYRAAVQPQREVMKPETVSHDKPANRLYESTVREVDDHDQITARFLQMLAMQLMESGEGLTISCDMQERFPQLSFQHLKADENQL